MKKKICLSVLTLMLAAGVMAGVQSKNVQAASKSKVKATVKGTTLTVSGTGAMPSNFKLTKKQKKKIKKIIIKKGVTSISNNAFEDCKKVTSITIPNSVKKIGWYSLKNTAVKKLVIPSSVKAIGQDVLSGCTKLKELTVPGNYKEKCVKGDEASYNMAWGVKLDKLTFNTDLQLVKVSSYDTKNLYVKKDDEKYQSIDGVLYSKDGKDIVRVPSLRKRLVIADGCENFCLQSVLYCTYDSEADPIGGCEKLTSVTIPASVKEINRDRYYALPESQSGFTDLAFESKVKTVTIQTEQLDGESLSALLQGFPLVKAEDVMKQLSQQITEKDGMYITTEGTLLLYEGKASTVNVPDNVKVIANSAFAGNKKIRKVVLPEGLTEIDDDAFNYCYDDSAQTGLKEVNLPTSLKRVGYRAFAYDKGITKIDLTDFTDTVFEKYAFADTGITELLLPKGITTIPAIFSGCNQLTEIIIPDSVVKVEAEAFSSCYSIKKLKFGKNLKEIGERAFDSFFSMDKLTIPDTVTTICSNAFGSIVLKKGFTIQGSTKNIAQDAFDVRNTLNYTKGISEARSVLWFNLIQRQKNGKYKVGFQFAKVKGVDGYQVVLSSDSEFKKNKKTFYYEGSGKKAAVKNVTLKKKEVYGKIRPYKVVNGKKVYGRWATDSMSLS